MSTPSNHIIFYDGYCGLCNRISRFIQRVDRKNMICFLPLQDGQSQKILSHYETLDDPTLYYLKDNILYLKSEAAIQAFSNLNGMWKLTKILKIIPVRIRDWIYDRIAENRYRIFGKYDSCQIIQNNATMKNKFLSTN